MLRMLRLAWLRGENLHRQSSKTKSMATLFDLLQDTIAAGKHTMSNSEKHQLVFDILPKGADTGADFAIRLKVPNQLLEDKPWLQPVAALMVHYCIRALSSDESDIEIH